MPRYSNPKIWRYKEEFKTKAVQLSYLEGARVHGHITYSELNGELKIIISRPGPICMRKNRNS
jgi:hypothetical protein